ncbi:hypothetical protein [Psittacicella gerlachiana]|uniref:DNA polymerase III subunit beta n=1 Tax=Psittacicella gerlachiana TaxID=2028574 RepID=A0A3A1YIQ2_9GAMM|nr:hypothetical protein [Psittacicella gerlachiana]RIY37139.1 hypothetical protein CKF59_01995 [Psittacicella gerlachiana]
MKLVLQAYKLQKALTTAREVVSKTLDPSIVLSQHVLLDFAKENQVTFLAGDKEINHSITIAVEPEEGEFLDFPESFTLYTKENEPIKQLSVSCNSFVDAITGLNGKTLVTLEFTKPPVANELTYANLTYETTVVRIEASNGQGYALLKESLSDAVSISTLDIPERIFKDIIQSTIFCVSVKASKHASLHTLILSLTPTQLKAFGGDYSRIALCSYFFREQKPYHIEGFNNFYEENPLTFNLSRRVGAELLRLLSVSEAKVRLVFHLTQSGHVQYLQLCKDDQELIFNLTYSKPPMYGHIVPDHFDDDVICNASEIKDKLNRSTKFGEIILINSAENVLTLSASNPGTLDSFSTEIKNVKTNPESEPLNLRVQGKHFIELINPLQESAKLRQAPVEEMLLSLNFVNKKVPVFVVKELDNNELDRTYVLTPYNNVASVDNGN